VVCDWAVRACMQTCVRRCAACASCGCGKRGAHACVLRDCVVCTVQRGVCVVPRDACSPQRWHQWGRAGLWGHLAGLPRVPYQPQRGLIGAAGRQPQAHHLAVSPARGGLQGAGAGAALGVRGAAAWTVWGCPVGPLPWCRMCRQRGVPQGMAVRGRDCEGVHLVCACPCVWLRGLSQFVEKRGSLIRRQLQASRRSPDVIQQLAGLALLAEGVFQLTQTLACLALMAGPTVPLTADVAEALASMPTGRAQAHAPAGATSVRRDPLASVLLDSMASPARRSGTSLLRVRRVTFPVSGAPMTPSSTCGCRRQLQCYCCCSCSCFRCCCCCCCFRSSL
jgi:hypothetical protein